MTLRRPLLVSALVLAASAAALAAPSARRLFARGEPVAWETVAARARQARLVFVGEEHGRREHHLLQRDLLAHMASAGPVLLGCEYFPRSLQPVLDRFNAGELDLDELPEAVGWREVWNHDWEAYRPLFALCQERRIPVIALNAERELVRRVRKVGLEGLELAERARLPRLDLDHPAHRERVIAQLQQVHPMPEPMRERYYQAFTVWDEVMADSVCEAFLRDRRPDLRMLVVAGRAHIEGGGTGIPDRVTRRLPLARLTVVCGEARPGDGDVILAPPLREGGAWY